MSELPKERNVHELIANAAKKNGSRPCIRQKIDGQWETWDWNRWYDKLRDVAKAYMALAGEIIRREDPRGATYYWIGGAAPTHVAESGTDFEAIENGQVSVTPLHRDSTHRAALHRLYEPKIEL